MRAAHTKKVLLISTLTCLCFHIQARDNIGIKFFGLSMHPFGDENAFLMPRKLDGKGYFVLNLGAMLSYEKFFWQDILSVKVIQAGYSDCAARAGGFSHIGIRGKIFSTKRQSLSGGIGPTLIYRRNWNELERYHDPGRFQGGLSDKWQYLFIWYGGEFEYKYSLNETFDFALCFVPGYPDLISFSLGINYKLN